MKDWKAVVLLLVIPFVFISFFSYALTPYLNRTGFLEPFDIAVVDGEGSLQTGILVNQLKEIEIFNEILKVDEDEARELILQNKIASAVIIPEGFSQSVMVGENRPVTVIGNSSMPLQFHVVRSLIESAANLVTAGQSAINTIYHYSREAGLEGEELEQVFKDSTMKILMQTLSRNKIFSQVEASLPYDLTPIEYFTASLIVVFLMFAGMPGMKMIVYEKTLGLTDRLAASSVKIWQMVLSKLIISFLLSIVQFSIIVVLTSVVFQNYWGTSIWRLLGLLGAVIFAVSSWAIFVSSVSKTSAAADVIGNLGILVMAVVGGSIYPLSSMPEIVRVLSRLTINRWAAEGFMVIFSDSSGLNITNQVIALVAIGLVFLSLSTVVLKLRRR